MSNGADVPQSGLGPPLLPPVVVPYLVAFGGLAGLFYQFLPEHTVGSKVAVGVLSFLSLFGIVSPGLRRS